MTSETLTLQRRRRTAAEREDQIEKTVAPNEEELAKNEKERQDSIVPVIQVKTKRSENTQTFAHYANI